MTSPQGEGPTSVNEVATPGRFDGDNIVKGTALSRLALAFRHARPDGSFEEDFTFSSSPASVTGGGGVPNPYGVGLNAYEPNTMLFDDYAEAYGASQQSKMEEEAAAQLLEADFTNPGGQAGLTGVPFADLFTAAAARHGVPAQLLAAVARAESNFSVNARSPAGAVGLMQFMPGTAAGLGVNPLDPASAIDGAARYLRQNYNQFGSWDLALAAYNAGPGNVSRYGGIPPFTETQNYVRRVNEYMGEYSSGLGTAPAPAGPTAQATGQVRSMISAAMNLAARRVPYVWGGTTASGVDCSGLIYYAAQAAGIDLPRLRAVDYGRMGTPVSLAQARPGDLVYFDNPNTSTDHLGIYIGNGQMIQAPQSGDVVKVTAVGGYTSIRRVFEDAAFGSIATPSGGTTTGYNGRPYSPGLPSSLAPYLPPILRQGFAAAPRTVTRTYDRRLMV